LLLSGAGLLSITASGAVAAGAGAGAAAAAEHYPGDWLSRELDTPGMRQQLQDAATRGDV
jgi:hypothetical protein